MQKLMTMFEDLWVAVAFAEAGEYDTPGVHDARLHFSDSVRMHAV